VGHVSDAVDSYGNGQGREHDQEPGGQSVEGVRERESRCLMEEQL
jgi:hypothetical protein